jgi:hypothetical protein
MQMPMLVALLLTNTSGNILLIFHYHRIATGHHMKSSTTNGYLLTSDRLRRNSMRLNRIYCSKIGSMVGATLREMAENHPSMFYLQRF